MTPARTFEPDRRPILWVSTSTQTRGGIASYIRTISETALWPTWSIEHVATHVDGTKSRRVLAFLRGGAGFATALLLRRPRLVHLHTASWGSFARKSTLFWLARALSVPIVLHVHGGEFQVFHDRMPRPLRAFIRTTLSSADAVVALGADWAERLHVLAPAAHIVVVPNPVRIGRPSEPPGPSEPVHVVYLGRIVDSKGAFALLDSWARIAPVTGPAPRLTIAGDGDVDRARRLVDAQGMSESVQIRDWLTRDEVENLLDTAHVLCLPSLNEGQPMAVLEAMARGLCVVATRVGGVPALVDHRRTGLLVQPGDTADLDATLRRVITDRDLVATLGTAAHDRVRREFDSQLVAGRLDALYRTVLDRRSRHHRPPARFPRPPDL